MKAYVITTGAIFGLIALTHILRFFTEEANLKTDMAIVLLTILAIALSFWAWRLARTSSRP